MGQNIFQKSSHKQKTYCMSIKGILYSSDVGMNLYRMQNCINYYMHFYFIIVNALYSFFSLAFMADVIFIFFVVELSKIT